MGLTVGQIMAEVGGGGGGGGVGGVGGGAASSLRGGPGKAELLLGLAQMARTLSPKPLPEANIQDFTGCGRFCGLRTWLGWHAMSFFLVFFHVRGCLKKEKEKHAVAGLSISGRAVVACFRGFSGRSAGSPAVSLGRPSLPLFLILFFIYFLICPLVMPRVVP